MEGSVIVMGLLGTLTYWNAMVPGPLPVEHGRPADSAYYFVFHRSYKEYVTGKEAEKPPTRTELGTELRRYRLDGWNPPKHFYVDITDLKTGESFERLYVSKHCNTSGQLQRGQEYNIMLNKYSLSNRPGEVLYEFPSLYSVFC